jgi:hypothetical protein
MVDFVRLQEQAANLTERVRRGHTVATAWPYTAGLRNPDFGFVSSPLPVIETGDFHYDSIERLDPSTFSVLITYVRTWAPDEGVIQYPIVRRFLTHFYEWQPDITREECADLGLYPLISWKAHGQEITIYTRKR